jgi:hypothetical protein
MLIHCRGGLGRAIMLQRTSLLIVHYRIDESSRPCKTGSGRPSKDAIDPISGSSRLQSQCLLLPRGQTFR